MATRLCEAGHYATDQIQQVSAQLDQDWKSFASSLEERSAILAMSSVFHQKAEQVSCSFNMFKSNFGTGMKLNPEIVYPTFKGFFHCFRNVIQSWNQNQIS